MTKQSSNNNFNAADSRAGRNQTKQKATT